jgi:hypothetical protein
MYECRFLFPDHARRVIRREIEAGRDDLPRRRRADGGCLRAADRARRGRS